MNNTQKRVLIGSLQKFSLDDGPGIRTTIFMKGCPLRCEWCHNPELINPEQQLIISQKNCIGCGYCINVCPQNAIKINLDGKVMIDRSKCDVCLKCADQCYAKALRPVAKSMTADEILDVAEQDKGFYENTGGGITISGGEILMHTDFVKDLVDDANRRDIGVCLDTSGYGDTKQLMEIALKENVTNILYDIKSIDDEVHKRYTGVDNKLIIDNLNMLAANETIKKKLIMRMPLIKGVNDNDDTIRRTGELYKRIGINKVNLLPYHSLGVNKKRNLGGEQEEFQPPTENRIKEIKTYFEDDIVNCVSIS